MTAPTLDKRVEATIDLAQNRHTKFDEMAVLGALMTSAPGSEFPARIKAILAPRDEDGVKHFTLPAHRLVWKIIIKLMEDGEPFDERVVFSRLPADKLALLDNGTYLLELTRACPTPANGSHYAMNVANATLLRGIADAAASQAQAALETSLHGAEDVLEAARARLDSLVPPGKEGSLISWRISGAEAIEEMERLQEIAQTPVEDRMTEFSSPWSDLDWLLGSVDVGSVIIIAGRPGMAKSTVARNWAQHLSMRKNLGTLFFSMEMSRLQIALAMMAAGARIPLAAIKNGSMSDEDWVQAARYLAQTADAPMEIDDAVGMNIAYWDRALTDHTRRHGKPPVAFFVDYLQLGEERGNNRQEQVSRMSRGLKMLAMKHGTRAIVLSQLNRGPEERADKRPMLSDLRESGSIEQDADIVILLHRDDYYDKESPRAGEIDFIVAKHRQGPTDTVTLAAQLHLSRIVSMAIV